MATTIFPPDRADPHATHSIGMGGIEDLMNRPASMSPKPRKSPQLPPADPEKDAYRHMSHDEWVLFCRGVGVFKDDESEEVTRPTSTWWPPRGFRDGLYQDVLHEQAKYSYYFQSLTVIRWTLMVVQLAMNATMTALGSLDQDGTIITIIAAINTSISGVLALMHNGGLPDRYRSNRNEFNKLEEHLKLIVDTALVPIDDSVNDVLADCFHRFRVARQTVQNNIPATYTTPTNGQQTPPKGGRNSQLSAPPASPSTK
ncbi:uncharacterized protein B0I36DRAFT_362873 [Microdochium trichocladiopsis]|uniref:SMODS and SLOG-associating 2TM effector domain-containing protein n=1 Tax=Microdochium trichocladiopsis TaxID=1682393 RepID=A0A9P8Y7H6_9PEZI|nr:uncharacterized protein B0I36DRAFT_362873 [Microdochium trichocladiopsis]KAH7031133.1 hypothetical protein B0I36DRAFT_362873 [Microdochium trichocladiopsis]